MTNTSSQIATDSTPTRAGNPRAAAAKRVRNPPFDGRTRSARRWRSLRDRYARLTGGKHPEMCGTLASLAIALANHDNAVASGRPVDADLHLRLASEARRLSERLGILAADGAEPADPEPLPPGSPSWLIGPREPEPSR